MHIRLFSTAINAKLSFSESFNNNYFSPCTSTYDAQLSYKLYQNTLSSSGGVAFTIKCEPKGTQTDRVMSLYSPNLFVLGIIIITGLDWQVSVSVRHKLTICIC